MNGVAVGGLRWGTCEMAGSRRRLIHVVALVLAMCAGACGAEPSSEGGIRRPVVAGSFYPGNARRLAAAVSGFVDKATPQKTPGDVKIVLAPHAGYPYSGETAGYAFKALRRTKDVNTVILIGCPHRAPVRDISIWPDGAYRTPLGDCPVDKALAAKIAKACGARFQRQAHLYEHSLEVEVPFVQTLFPKAKIVPILVHRVSPSARDRIVAALADALKQKGVVLVVSTDFSHYPVTGKVARQVDEAALASLKRLDADHVDAVCRRLLSAGHKNLVCAMCARQAVTLALRAARRVGLDTVTVLNYTNSAAKTGPGHVVGYGAVAISDTGRKPPPLKRRPQAAKAPRRLDAAARKELLAIARTSAKASLEGRSWTPPRPRNRELLQLRGCFVTLKNKGKLRGCLGRFSADRPLYLAVARMAGDSATRDYRFRGNPVTLKELPDITMDISVLSPLRRVSSWKEIKLGVQGVAIRRGRRSGVFLPQVATETGWGLEKFLRVLCAQKAGLPPDAYKDPDTVIEVFDAEVFGDKAK